MIVKIIFFLKKNTYYDFTIEYNHMQIESESRTCTFRFFLSGIYV